MAQFDSSIPENPAEQILQDRVCNLENGVTQVQGDNHRLVEQVRLLSEIARQPVHYYAPQNPTSADLHIPPPTPFNGAATTLPDFKIKLHNFFSGSPGLYDTASKQLLYAGNLMAGPVAVWYNSQVDPSTLHLPPSWDLSTFLAALEAFFGGGVTTHSRERDFRNLRQTSSVSDLAIAFQNITNMFPEVWPNHALIFFFSDKLNSPIRYELIARGNIPTTFQAYVAAAISIEHNQAAAHQQKPHPPRPPFSPPPHQTAPHPHQTPFPPQPPAQRQLPPSPFPNQHVPMDLDGTRGPRGPLSLDERRRRFQAGLCAYCGQAGHTLATCPNHRHVQARATHLAPGLPAPPPGYEIIPSSQLIPAGYQLVPPGLPPPSQGSYPGPWTPVPSPHTQFFPALPKNDFPSQ